MLLVFTFSGLSLLSEALGPNREQREGWQGLLLWSYFGWGAVYSGGLSAMLGVVEDAAASVFSS